jgi:hypothetical protein
VSRFKLRRQRESDGSPDHVLKGCVVGADGRLLYQYLYNTSPIWMAGDLTTAESKIVADSAENGESRGS